MKKLVLIAVTLVVVSGSSFAAQMPKALSLALAKIDCTEFAKASALGLAELEQAGSKLTGFSKINEDGTEATENTGIFRVGYQYPTGCFTYFDVYTAEGYFSHKCTIDRVISSESMHCPSPL